MAHPHPKPSVIHRASDDLVLTQPITLAPVIPDGEDDPKHRRGVAAYLCETLAQTRLSPTLPTVALHVAVRAVDAVGARYFLRVAPLITGPYGQPTTIPLTEEFALVTGLRLFHVHDSATARDGRRSTNLVVEVPHARSHSEMAQQFAAHVQRALKLEAVPIVIEF